MDRSTTSRCGARTPSPTDDEPGRCTVSVLDSVQQLAVSGRADLGPLAEEVRGRMKRALTRV